jgi:uncharacterized YigZ family protein
MSGYETVSGYSECEVKIKGSRFISCSGPCPDEAGIGRFLENVRSRYPSATHYCYAAIFNGTDRSERFSDNGEPSGTAGRPMMDVLRNSGLTDTVVVVVRYFGGTLLGTGGLVQAYSGGTKDVLDIAGRTESVLCKVYRITVGYSEYGHISASAASISVGTPAVGYGSAVTVRFCIRDEESDRFEEIVRDVTKGTVKAYSSGREYVPKN